MRKIFLIILLVYIGLSSNAMGPDSLLIFFWNVENLFYPENDSIKNDDEFTPYGDRYWGWEKYHSKLSRIWKTIIAAGDPLPPEIIALAEIESREVLRDLFVYSPAGIYEYEILHYESDDRRGIDVAILYDPVRMKLLNDSILDVPLEEIGGGSTRDILFAEFEWNKERFILFINHWPSKYGGAGVTEKFRMKAAATLTGFIKKITTVNEDANLICMGDFNDTEEASCLQLVRSGSTMEIMPFTSNSIAGTYKYQGEWQNIDHILISEGLQKGRTGLKAGSACIFSPGFLLETDDLYGGIKPYRTWKGYQYRKGFSDHLPVTIRLFSLSPAH